jgi:hypothetical protein
MSNVQNDPAELRQFMAGMRQFDAEVGDGLRQMRSQLYNLSNTWRDGQYAHFSGQLETALQAFQRYLQTSEGYHQYLDQKATILEQYLGQQ